MTLVAFNAPALLICPALAFQLKPATCRFGTTTRVTSHQTKSFVLSVGETSDTNELDGDRLDDESFSIDILQEKSGNDMDELRSRLKEAAAVTTPNEETAETAERILLRMVDKWYSDPNPGNELTAHDFYTVRIELTDALGCEDCQSLKSAYEQERVFRQSKVGRIVEAQRLREELGYFILNKNLFMKKAV